MARTASTRSAKSAPAKRGRPAKEEVKAKRGRPAKAAPAKRGRPAKAAAVKRGRPAKAAPAKRAKKSKEIAGLQRVQVTATTIATFRAYLHEVTNDTIVYSLKKPNSSRVYRHVMPITSVVAVQGAPGGFAVLTLRMPVSLMAFDSVSYQAVDGFLSFTTTDDTVVTVRSDDEDVHVGISELEEDASYLEEDEVEVEVEGDDEEGLDEDEAFDDEEAAGMMVMTATRTSRTTRTKKAWTKKNWKKTPTKKTSMTRTNSKKATTKTKAWTRTKASKTKTKKATRTSRTKKNSMVKTTTPTRTGAKTKTKKAWKKTPTTATSWKKTTAKTKMNPLHLARRSALSLAVWCASPAAAK